MPLVTIRDLTIGFRGPPLLDHVSCQIDEGQRIGLLGRNGAGKTTLMRILAGCVEPDSGQVLVQAGARIAMLQQEVPQNKQGPIADVVREGLFETSSQDEANWKAENQVENILSRMELNRGDEFNKLSSGMKRRVLLAQALVSSPDLLLLDEPTNHLDLDAINWLEEFLLRSNMSLMFVTHDRMFLRNIANRILEIDRGRIFDWTCDYDTFLVRKEQALEAEEKQNALFDKRLAEEEVWIRKGIKARRIRNEGRVKALKKLRLERQQRREKLGTSRIQIQQGQRSGSLVLDAEEISFSFPDLPIVKDFSTTIMRGDKVGIIGPNGAGKTTLLRLLLGQLKPDAGKVRLGTNLQIAYFDQLREQLDENQTVAHNVADGYESLEINGAKKHILGYLQDFLFAPERARTEVRFLSGGERNRILLAKLFAKPANLIILDEPTNDLDAETLELLEERLIDYKGTVIIVSHDRAFLNNVVSSTIAFEDGNVKEYDGGYDDWVRQRPVVEAVKTAKPGKKTVSVKSNQAAKKPRKLTFKEKRELENLPSEIESLEAEIAELHSAMADPSFYQQAGGIIAESQSLLKERDKQLTTAYQRWEELEELRE